MTSASPATAHGGPPRLARNIRDLPSALTPAAWLAGLVAVLIAYTGQLVLVFQAAEQARLSHTELASWIWAFTVGSGLATLPLCLWYTVFHADPSRMVGTYVGGNVQSSLTARRLQEFERGGA